jgi:hypothetical protein
LTQKIPDFVDSIMSGCTWLKIYVLPFLGCWKVDYVLPFHGLGFVVAETPTSYMQCIDPSKPSTTVSFG